MQTNIHPDLINLPVIREADSILRKCVHCGFCTATCPTYQLTGDELDGPRGRIYLIKNLLEDNQIGQSSLAHLDRCLTCRACETTCPSGVEYGRLLDIGREFATTLRPWPYRLLSRLLRWFIPKRWLFKPLLRIGQLCRPVLPRVLRRHVPIFTPVRHAQPSVKGAKVLLLSGCVQSAATPNVVAAMAKILADQGMESEVINEGCCGALDYHLSAHEAARSRMKKVIDLLTTKLDGVEAIVSSATGCGVTIKEYPEILKFDPDYAARAQLVANKVMDPVEYFSNRPMHPGENPRRYHKVAIHTPCSMQHGMGLVGEIEKQMSAAGFSIVEHKEGHLCCGSAGTYSILQSDLSGQLRDRKLKALCRNQPDVIVTANVGCQLHLGEGSNIPVMHWLELIADGLAI
jgi:glycolate oxidase iron-sulfur subunit